MYIPKRYGQSQIAKCPFCSETATTMNNQKIPVCRKHTERIIDNVKCACGRFVVPMQGKFGPFFNCLNCGNLNLKKILEINNLQEK